jgi:hypothetical protein
MLLVFFLTGQSKISGPCGLKRLNPTNFQLGITGHTAPHVLGQFLKGIHAGSFIPREP